MEIVTISMIYQIALFLVFLTSPIRQLNASPFPFNTSPSPFKVSMSLSHQTHRSRFSKDFRPPLTHLLRLLTEPRRPSTFPRRLLMPLRGTFKPFHLSLAVPHIFQRLFVVF